MLPAERVLRGQLRRRDVHGWPAEPTCSAGSATSCTSPGTPTSRSARRTGAGSRWPVRAANAGCRPATGPLEDVPVELRGAGACSRQVNNFCSADSFEADRLIAVEVLTPAGNWSSYPPHKHDEDRPGEESVLEEIYYFEVARDGMGYHRVYGTPDRPIDVLAEVRTRRRGARAARLARAVDGGAGLRPLLPQRDGRSRRRTGLGRSATTRRTPGSAAPGTASRSTRGCR